MHAHAMSRRPRTRLHSLGARTALRSRFHFAAAVMRLLDKCLLYRLPKAGPTTIGLRFGLSKLTFMQAEGSFWRCRWLAGVAQGCVASCQPPLLRSTLRPPDDQ